MLNWFFSRPKSNVPEPTALQTQRAKQIDQLKAFNQNVSEIHRDVEYRVNFIVSGSNLSLYITLPPQFPQERPSVKVSPPVRHPWVNDLQLVTGCTGLNNFVVHSDLGKVIRSIVEEFQRNPPVMLPQQSFTPRGLPYPVNPSQPAPPTLTGYTPYTGLSMPKPTYMAGVAMPTLAPSSSSSSNIPQIPSSAYQPPTHQSSLISSSGASLVRSGSPFASTAGSSYQMPEMPMSIPAIQDLSVQDLQKLADDEDRILEMLRDFPQMEKIAQDRQNLFKENERLAEENVAKKPLLEENKRLLLEKYDSLNDMRQKFDEKCSQQELLRGKFDPSALQANLKVAAMGAEEEAETVAEGFLEGSMPVEEFLKKYMDKRKLSYLRKAKEEKLAQYIVRGGF